MMNDGTIKVWSAFIRLFHWTLVAAFAAAYLTEGEPAWLHAWLGYLIAGLLLARIAWGFISNGHAGFRDFVRGPRTILQYLRDDFRGRASRYLGHNPAGGAMILALISVLLLTAASGMALLAADAGQGPLAGWLISSPDPRLAEGIEEVHEVLANVALLLVATHVVAVLVESLRHRENLVRAMITGRKRANP